MKWQLSYRGYEHMLRTEEQYNSVDKIKIFYWLRTIALLFVVFFHYSFQFDKIFRTGFKYPLVFSNFFGKTGVMIFFMISGFVIFNSDKHTNRFSFLIKRFFRLMPTYWSAIFLTFFSCELLLPNYNVTFCTALANLLVFQKELLNIQYVDGAYWTMPITILFYIFATFFICQRTTKHITIFLLIWILSSLIFNTVYFFADYHPFLLKLIGNGALKLNSHDFIVGAVAALLYNGYKNKYLHLITLLCIINVCIVEEFSVSVFFCLLGILFYSIGYRYNSFNYNFCPSIISFLSSISYPFYLVHQKIGWGIIANMRAVGLKEEVYLIFPFLICIVLAMLLHQIVEVPSGKWAYKLNLL